MTFNEHSPIMLEKIQELYKQAVSGSVSAALLTAMKFGWELARRDSIHISNMSQDDKLSMISELYQQLDSDHKEQFSWTWCDDGDRE